jgi:anti-sigma factor RsiW
MNPEDTSDGHFDEEPLEQYALGKSTGADLAAVEEHLLVCQRCRDRLAELERFISAFRGAVRGVAKRPMDYTHHTELGPARLRASRKGGGWMALVSGRDLEYGRQFEALYDANLFLMQAFHELFPEHRCTDQCGPTPR